MNQSIDDIDQRMILNVEYLAQNLQPMTLPVFIRNMHITRSKDETQEFTDNADLIRYGSKFIEQWYQIYRIETQKYNIPKRQLLPKRPQPIPKQEIEEQRILTNPYRTKSRQASQNIIQDYQLKPLRRLQRPYFSPKSGSYEIDLAFSYDTIKHREQIYLFAININTKYLVVIPIIDKSAAQLKNALTKLINSQYVNNIRSDGEKGLTAQSSSGQSDQNDQRWIMEELKQELQKQEEISMNQQPSSHIRMAM
ncbi:MAG: hypothetical protein EZS28_028863 [Streblomastix strix]|uniref:Integrase catalytic domain-containing protein n=1 Tax=Streblomastix strix TaxID=222440 RepID=A0A5J4UYM6_9EUKA|nr:MAG: hypothetical protein EZS28_028863 [Streblomastix strix]